jgi:hypothetical protein
MSRTTSKERMLLGGEPIVKKGDSLSSISNAFTWYAAYYARERFDQSRKFAIDHLKKINFSPEIIQKLENLSKKELKYFPVTIGWILRQKDIDSYVPEDLYKKAFIKIEQFFELNLSSAFLGDAIDDEAPEKEKESTETPVIGATPKSSKPANSLLADVEEILDRFYKNNYSLKEFDPTTFLRSKNIKDKAAMMVADHLGPITKEIWLALKEKDPDIVEGYRDLDKTTLTRYYAFLSNFLQSSLQFAETMKIVSARKPRKKKVKTAQQLVTKVKYQASNDKYKLQGESPASIVGANQVWVFNTKTRFLGVYHTKGPETSLSIKGSTVINYDPKLSIQKKVRKPDIILKEVISGGKVALRKVLGEINAKEKMLSGRINKDTLIVRTLR